jgi:hypothetical protein
MAVAMKDAMARTAAVGRLYADFTVTDAGYSNPQFLCAETHFLSTNAWGGAPTYPVVVSWGGLEKGNSGNATLTLAVNAYLVPANSSTLRFTVAQWLRELNLTDVAISIYQWTEEAPSPVVIWAGYISHFDTRLQNGVAVADLILTASSRDMEMTPASDVVNPTDFTTAPLTAQGLMVPINSGDLQNKIFSGGPRNAVGMIGHPMSGVKGLVIADDTSAQTVTVRLTKNDGTNTAKAFVEQSADGLLDGSQVPLEGDLWIHDSGYYGIVNRTSYVPTNDANKVECAVNLSPSVYFFMRPSIVGSTLASGFASSINKLINADITDGVESTTTDYIWAFDCPVAQFPGTVKTVWVLVDWQNNHATKQRRIQYGLWDVFGSAGAAYLDGQSTLQTRNSGLARLMQGTIDPYDAWNFRAGAHEAGSTSTQAEFRSGRFVTRGNADGEEASLQLRVEVNDLGGANSGRDGVKVYHLILVVEVEYPQVPKFNIRPWLSRYNLIDEKDEAAIRNLQNEETIARQQFKVDEVRARKEILSRLRGTDFFGTGSYEKDDGSGTYTGTIGQVVERPCEVAQKLLHKRYGKAVNATASTLGNFVDARETVLKFMSTAFSFGPDEVKRGETIDILNRTTPMEVFEKDKTWLCIPDDMNPHSSRLYRSASEIVKIGPADIERDSWLCARPDPRDIVNSVVINHAHGYPDREPGMTTTYDQKYSQFWWGKKASQPIDAPFIINKQYDGGPSTGAINYAQWQGRRFARPRLKPSMKLTQKFYDLEQGHIVQLAGLEDMGIQCMAFRCGLLDYYFKSQTDTVNQADSFTPAFVQVGSTSSISLGFSQQPKSITFYVSVAAAYTTVANSWKYSDAGGTMTAFGDANTTNKDALKSTGIQTVSFVLPAPTAICKQERTFGAFGAAGPCYWYDMDYIGAGTAGTGSYRTGYPGIWDGRLFEVRRATRMPSGEGDYMAMGVSLREVM